MSVIDLGFGVAKAVIGCCMNWLFGRMDVRGVLFTLADCEPAV